MNEERIRAFAAQAAWYHTIQLRPDVKTTGIFDHAPFLGHYRFPDNLSGLGAGSVRHIQKRRILRGG